MICSADSEIIIKKQFLILQELVHAFPIFLQCHKLFHVVSRNPRCTSLFYSLNLEGYILIFAWRCFLLPGTRRFPACPGAAYVILPAFFNVVFTCWIVYLGNFRIGEEGAGGTFLARLAAGLHSGLGTRGSFHENYSPLRI